MVTFTTFNNRLPDPTFGVSNAGTADTAGSYGPGWANVSVTSNRPVQTSRTISGRGIQTQTGAQYWEINISYHPMKRDDFDIISAFLDARNGKFNPFFVVLPQNSKPKDPLFATFVASNPILARGSHTAGSNYITVDTAGILSGNLKPGDFFNIDDVADVNHQKAYKVTRVESAALYQTGTTSLVANKELRIWTVPPLVRNVSDNATIRFINPTFRVIQKADVLEYQLDTNNTYQFQLQLEEIQV